MSRSSDFISIQPRGVVFAAPVSGSPAVFLTLLFGNSGSVFGLGSSGGVVGTNALGATTAGAQAFAIQLVDLGGGRILVVCVADEGDSTPVGSPLLDGVYAQVYNMNTGGPEGAATQILNFGVGLNDNTLSGIEISAGSMADGRVVLGVSFNNGLSRFDVFNTVLDPRITVGIIAATSPGSETLVGTAFDDTFTCVSAGDRIIGGAGVDTAVFGPSTGRSVDLQNPGSFPANTFVLLGIENLMGNVGADLFRGDGVGHVLFGIYGNDTLYGRDGNDSRFGGAYEDLLFDGAPEDLLDGGAGFDTLAGGTGDDLTFGGTEADRMLGGTEKDTVFGGDADDLLQGNAGDDILSGDTGNDFLTGGVGDDDLAGGAGPDTLHAEEGGRFRDGSRQDLAGSGWL